MGSSRRRAVSGRSVAPLTKEASKQRSDQIKERKQAQREGKNGKVRAK